MNYNILLIEDDISICEVIVDYFKRESKGNVKVRAVNNGDDGLCEFYEKEYDLVILDVMLPGTDGLSLCREMRKDSMVPIMFVTAKNREQDILLGYDLGCDDYITKPFSLSTTYAKCIALINRSKGMIQRPLLECADIVLNPSTYTVSVSGKEVLLAKKEYAILKLLLENKNKLVARERILINIWGYDYDGSDRCVDNHIRKLRKSLGQSGKNIKTIIGRGYKIEP